MKKQMTAAALLLLVLCLTLSGCNVSVSSVDGLMHPPKLSGENSLLQSAFEATVSNKDNIIMKTPLIGEYRSSYLVKDINADGKDEAFVLYSNPAEGEYACVSVFENSEDGWAPLTVIKGQGDEIFEIDFADINGDGVFEIVISWTYLNDSAPASNIAYSTGVNRVMTVYSLTQGDVKPLKTEPFNKLFISDLNQDGTDEIFIINIDLSENSSRTLAKILSFSKDFSPRSFSEFPIENLIEILNITTDYLEEENGGFTRLYIDGSVNNNAVITEIIEIDSQGFEVDRPLSDFSESPTLRDVKTYCTDIDNDGVIEIPTTRQIPNSRIISDKGDSTPLNLTVWSQFENSEISVDFTSVLNSAYGYVFKIPKQLEGKISVVLEKNSSVLRVYELDGEALGKELFSVLTLPEVSWSAEHYSYTRFLSYKNTVCGYLLTEYGQQSGLISADDIQNNFIIID